MEQSGNGSKSKVAVVTGHCAQENINSLPPQHNVIPYFMKVCSVDISQPQAHSVPGISLFFYCLCNRGPK